MEEYRSLNFHSLCKYYQCQKARFVSEGPILALESIFPTVAGNRVCVNENNLALSQSISGLNRTVRNLPGMEQKLSSENTKCICETDLSPHKSSITITSWKGFDLSQQAVDLDRFVIVRKYTAQLQSLILQFSTSFLS